MFASFWRLLGVILMPASLHLRCQYHAKSMSLATKRIKSSMPSGYEISP